MKISDFLWQLILTSIVSYFIGNINSAVIISNKVKHQDIRQQGSKNPGTTNMMRVFGLKMGAVTLICDMIKGVIPVLLTRVIFYYITYGAVEIYRFAMYLSALCVTVGHVLPVFMKFKGGKGFATSIGIMLVVQPLPTLVIIAIGFVILLLCDRMSVFALFYITAELVFHILAYVGIFAEIASFSHAITLPILIVVILLWLLVVSAHGTNILRLIRGNENPSGFRKALMKKKSCDKSIQNDTVDTTTDNKKDVQDKNNLK